MDQMERDIAILRKLLNGKLFLNKFPVIERVAVEKYGDSIDVIMILNDTKEYFKVVNKIFDYVWQLKRMVDVESRISIYP